MCLLLHFAFSLTPTLSRSFQSVTAKNRKEILAVQTSYRKEVLALLSCNCKEVLAVSRTQAQATSNQPQEELLFFLQTQKEVLAHTLFLGCTIAFGDRHFSKCSCSEQKTRTSSGPRPPI